MEEIKCKLVESGIIGLLVDDFNPCLKLIVSYGDKQIGLGDQVPYAEVQRSHPQLELQHIDALDLQFHKAFKNPRVVAFVMTDVDTSGTEYLHWYAIILNSDQISVNLAPQILQWLAVCDLEIEDSPDFPWRDQELIAYEPPRPGAHTLVLTLFEADKFLSLFPLLPQIHYINPDVPLPIILPDSRENFSTRTFAETNGLESPLCMAFFKIKSEIEHEIVKNEMEEETVKDEMEDENMKKGDAETEGTSTSAGLEEIEGTSTSAGLAEIEGT